jgi:hypothetical protein
LPASADDPPPESFRFPLPRWPRIAVVDAHFRPDRHIREFSISDRAGLLSCEPQALVLPLGVALSYADQKGRGLLHLPSLNTAIIVLTSLGDGPLEDHHRDLLWHAFRVPIFEQLRGWDGAIIARECEVHDGLHIDERVISTGTALTGGIVTEPCECGSKSPRLYDIATVAHTPVSVDFD